MVVDSSIQRITRLTPLSAVLAVVERVGPVQPRRCRLAKALDRTLAEDAVASLVPGSAIALRDGFAVQACAIADAGPYAPVPLASAPPRVDVGEFLPNGTDAIMPLDTIAFRENRAEAIAAVLRGEGVLPAGADATPQRPLRRAGQVLRLTDIAVMAAAGIVNVTVRVPRIHVAWGGAGKTPLIAAAGDILFHTIAAAGGRTLALREGLPQLEDALADTDADAVIAVGGTGSGRQDASVRTLARLGRVEAYGIAVSPGESAAFGFADARPVLLIPGRLDATLATWLLIGRYLIARLAGGSVEDLPRMLPLKRKVSSTIGLVELIPVDCTGGMAEPLGSGYLTFESLARSDGWIVIPADSEGFAAGTPVAVRSWP